MRLIMIKFLSNM